ncbi:MAG: cupin domain-containing protein, partial [Lentisphaerae bacterium]
PTHFHPNCDEILHLLEGTLEHRLPDGTTTVLQPGDTICLRKGEVHDAKNIGSEDAVAMIIFNDAIRKVTPVSAADGEA